jgi:abortive infection bacteriophage resistance protein
LARFDKVAIDVEQQVSLLRSRGLRFSDEKRVEHYLRNIGYYRLSAYWLPFEEPGMGGSRSHQFRPETTFEQILSLYIYDRKLRLVVMEAIERVEIAIRTRWAQAMARRYGPHAHLQVNLFRCPWQHSSDIARVAADLKGSRETFVRHYLSHYDDPFLPPIWAVVETLSLGALSRWFQATKDTEVKREIMRGVDMPTIEVLEKVLHALTPVRNVCAHHGRLWNRRFTLRLPMIKRFGEQMAIEPIATPAQNQKQPSGQIYNYLLVLVHLMRSINPGSSWRSRLCGHINDATAEQQASMGFARGWASGVIWSG